MAQQVHKAVLFGKLFNAVEVRNVFYWGADAANPMSYADSAFIIDRVVELEGYARAISVNNLVYYKVETFNLVGTAWVPVRSRLFNDVGNLTADLGSYQTAALATAKTQVKRATGRKFLAGISETVTLDSQITWTGMISFAVFAVRWLAPLLIGTTTWYAGIPSKNSAFAPFTDIIGNALLSTMRRRKPGYGS